MFLRNINNAGDLPFLENSRTYEWGMGGTVNPNRLRNFREKSWRASTEASQSSVFTRITAACPLALKVVHGQIRKPLGAFEGQAGDTVWRLQVRSHSGPRGCPEEAKAAPFGTAWLLQNVPLCPHALANRIGRNDNCQCCEKCGEHGDQRHRVRPGGVVHIAEQRGADGVEDRD